MTDAREHKHIEFSPSFNKLLTKAPTEIKLAVRESVELFAENPSHPALRNHPLTGTYAGLRSIDVTPDYRALYRQEGDRIIFTDLGTHEELYG